MTISAADLALSWTLLESMPPPPHHEVRTEELGPHISAGAICTGIDAAGRRHLLLPLSPGVSPSEDMSSEAVQLVGTVLTTEGVQHQYLDLVCCRPDLFEVFTALSNDVLRTVGHHVEEPGPHVLRTLSRWRELFQPATQYLGSAALLGLAGELVALDQIRSSAGLIPVAVWNGPSRARHDLANGDVALEVKTSTARNGRPVRIHGHDQLQDPPLGQLFLSWIRLERVSQSGFSVPELVSSLRGLVDDAHAFLLKLQACGYRDADARVYEHIRFVTTEQLVYRVDDHFPRMTPASFTSGRVPAGVSDIAYSIDLGTTPPVPLDEASSSQVFARLGGRS